MTRRQASILIALVAVLVLVVAGIGAALVLRSPTGSDPTEEAAESPETSIPTVSEGAEEPADPAVLLEDAGLDVVMVPPVPDAPAEWGGYRLHRSWDGQIRAFEDSPATVLAGPDQSVFPASQNACGVGSFFITFRAVNADAVLKAQLKNAVDTVLAEDDLSSGWMLGTNCAIPQIGLAELPGEGSLTDVAYTVHEYRQASAPSQEQQPQQGAPTTHPTPTVTSTPQVAPPVLVECLIFGLGPQQGRYSDGSIREAPECQSHPDYLRMLEAERVCGGFNGWMEVTAERYRELCGVPPPTERFPAPSPSPDGYDEYQEYSPY